MDPDWEPTLGDHHWGPLSVTQTFDPPVDPSVITPVVHPWRPFSKTASGDNPLVTLLDFTTRASPGANTLKTPWGTQPGDTQSGNLPRGPLKRNPTLDPHFGPPVGTFHGTRCGPPIVNTPRRSYWRSHWDTSSADTHWGSRGITPAAVHPWGTNWGTPSGKPPVWTQPWNPRGTHGDPPF